MPRTKTQSHTNHFSPQLLNNDPHELKDLANNPEYKSKLEELKAELKTWTAAQGDDLLPHKDPYLTSEPIPVIKQKPKKKK